MLTASVSQVKRSTLEPKDHWHTPENVLEIIRNLYGGSIPLDVCSDDTNPTQADRFFTPDSDGLLQPWDDKWFGNIPFSNKAEWLSKAAIESQWSQPGVILAPDAILQNKGTRDHAQGCNGFACLGRVKFIPGPTLIEARRQQWEDEELEIHQGKRVQHSFRKIVPASPPDNIVALHYGDEFWRFKVHFERLGYPVYRSGS